MEYVIVDIETTGGFASGNGITEVAIHIHNGKEIIETFETLINPKQHIPLHITALTGINNEMVMQAPTFTEIAPVIYNLLSNRVFVAHNVNFDYSFIKHHLALAGFEWSAKKLCTVRLSRKIFPGLPSYSLGKLCASLQIPIINRHRAGGDTTATSILFSKLLENDIENFIDVALKKASKEQVLPPHLPKQHFEALPQTPGVYYFKNQKGKVIYVGKAKNLKSRVSSHFSGQNPSPQRQEFLRNIHSIDFEVCGTELIAFLLEAKEIKRLWPSNNRAMKRFEPKFDLYIFEDQNGYLRLGIDKHKKHQMSLYSFKNQVDGYFFVNKLVNEYQLCPKLCFLQKTKQACFNYQNNTCNGACIGKELATEYNKRLNNALTEVEASLPSFVLIDKGRNDNEKSCIWVEKGKLYGLGYLDNESDLNALEDIKSLLTPYQSNEYMMTLILNYAEKYPYKLTYLQNSVLY